MICARFFRKNGSLSSVAAISGHAGFADAGEDIVCASVSSAVQLVANGITECAKQQAGNQAGKPHFRRPPSTAVPNGGLFPRCAASASGMPGAGFSRMHPSYSFGGVKKMLRISMQFFAHKKGVGSTKNGRDSESKRLGVKRADGQFVLAGNILGSSARHTYPCG